MKATDNISKIEYIEDNYPVNKIRVSNVGMWMYLRNVIWDQLENNNIHNSKSTITNGIKAVKNYYWNYKNRNNDNNYILFTDTYEEVMVNNYPIDRLMYDVAEELQDNLSVVLNPMGANHKNSAIYTNNKYMSSHYFTFGMPKKHNIKGKNVLDEIIDYLNISIDYKNLINRFIMYYNRTYNFLEKSKPEKIIINCYHTSLHQAVILSANTLQIPTYEIQHGLISKRHFPYNFSNCLDSNFLPKYLFAFGRYVENCIGDEYKKYVEIISTGNTYLDTCIKNNQESDPDEKGIKNIIAKSKSYEKMILISHQDSIADELNLFIKELANKEKDVLFVYSMRNKNTQKISYINNQDNIIINDDVSIYTMAKYCDIHLSVYSTFILESLYMGIPNILININNISQQYIADIIKDDNIIILNSVDEVSSAINNNQFEDTNIIKEKMSFLYSMEEISALKQKILN